jgi:hypothetical protein
MVYNMFRNFLGVSPGNKMGFLIIREVAKGMIPRLTELASSAG